MFDKVFQATHPDMMDGAANQQLRDRYLVQGMFVPGEVKLNYSHNERFVIGGAVPSGGPVKLPLQAEPKSAEGKPFLERRELGVVNIGEAGAVNAALFTVALLALHDAELAHRLSAFRLSQTEKVLAKTLE